MHLNTIVYKIDLIIHYIGEKTVFSIEGSVNIIFEKELRNDFNDLLIYSMALSSFMK